MSLAKFIVYPIISFFGLIDYVLNFFYTSETRESLIAPSDAVLTKAVDETKSVYRQAKNLK